MSLMSAAIGISNALGISDTILSLFGGNNGDKVAKKIIDITQAVTGKKTINDSLRLLEDPQIAVRVHEAILKQEVELNALAFGDIQHARERQDKALEQQDKFSKRFIYYFAFYWSLIATAYMFGITFFTLTPAATRFADTILGFLMATIIGGIISFFYGASMKQSKPK